MFYKEPNIESGFKKINNLKIFLVMVLKNVYLIKIIIK